MEKILLVDSESLPLQVQQGFFANSPVSIHTAADMDRALAIAVREVPDLIIIGKQQLPQEAIAFCKTVKADPLLKHIPLLLVTGAIGPAEFEAFRAAGYADCIPKPIDRIQYLTVVRRYLPTVERRGVRVPLQTEVRLTAYDDFHVAVTRDVGMKGVQLASELQPKPGEELQISFVLPGSDAPTEVRGKVAWLRPNGGNGKPGAAYGFGVEFLEITGKGMPQLRKGELERFVSHYGGSSLEN